MRRAAVAWTIGADGTQIGHGARGLPLLALSIGSSLWDVEALRAPAPRRIVAEAIHYTVK